MQIHRSFGDTTLTAQSASVGSFAGMNSLMNPQRSSLREPTPAMLANARFLAGMDPFMLLKLLLPAEGFNAKATFVRLVSGVYSSMEL